MLPKALKAKARILVVDVLRLEVHFSNHFTENVCEKIVFKEYLQSIPEIEIEKRDATRFYVLFVSR